MYLKDKEKYNAAPEDVAAYGLISELVFNPTSDTPCRARIVDQCVGNTPSQ